LKAFDDSLFYVLNITTSHLILLSQVIFAKPSKTVPVPPASAHIKVIVHFENTKYVAKGFTVEGKKQVFGTDFPFNEAWIDGIIVRKMKFRDSFDFVSGSEFLKTRLGAGDGVG
jgi:hypothetical protein